MKKKNRINPIEQHFEKAILIGVSVILLGVVSMQFLTQPNAVKVGNSGDPVPPNKVFDAIVDDAETLLAQIRNPSPSLPDIPEQDVAKRFEEVRSLSGADSLKLAYFGDTANIETLETGDTGGELAATTYAMPALPVPATVVAATYRAAVDPIEALSNDALKPYLPAQQPYDALAVSIEGTVSGEGLLESLQADPDDDGPVSPLPLMWWRGNIDLLGVEVLREELTPSGDWTNATVVSGMPGEFSAIEEARRPDITSKELQNIAEDSLEMGRQLVQPSFPRTVAGPEWVRPSEIVVDQGLTEEDRQIARWRKAAESAKRRLEVNQEELASIGGGGGGGGAFNERGGGGGRRGGEGGGGGGQSTDLTQKRRDRLELIVQKAQDDYDRAVAELADLGVYLDEESDQDSNRDKPDETPIPPILDAADLPVWVHDFTAEPGKTYRYRMRVVLNNPLYGRGLYLSDAQKPAADSPTLEGGWSDWTDPVGVERDRQFFIVSASEDDQLGSGPRAAVEVYQFYYGYWRKGSATLSPGDTIHTRTRLPDNLLLWDPDKLKELGRLPTPGARGPGMLPGGPESGRPGREFNERDLLRQQQDPGRPTGRPRPGEKPELPEGAEPGPELLELDVPAMLLDVIRVPGEDNVFQAVLKGSDGSLVIRDASADRSGLLYRRLVENARAGEEAGRPEPEPNQGRPIQQEERDIPDPGGGGGGPGGG